MGSKDHNGAAPAGSGGENSSARPVGVPAASAGSVLFTGTPLPPHLEKPKSLREKFEDVATRAIGSMGFVALQTATLAAWVVGNMLANTWDPSSQIILNLALSFQAAYTGPLVMITQNRQAELDRKARDNDAQVNIESKRRVMGQHAKVNTMLRALNPLVSMMSPEQRKALNVPDKLMAEILEGRLNSEYEEPAEPEPIDNPTLSQKFADAVTGKIGSWKFILAQSASLALWIGANTAALVQHWDPYPFILLNLALSFQAAYTGPLVMMSQNRQNALDRKAREINYKVNREEEHLIEELDDKMDALVALWAPVMAALTPEQLRKIADSMPTLPPGAIPAAAQPAEDHDDDHVAAPETHDEHGEESDHPPITDPCHLLPPFGGTGPAPAPGAA